MRSADPPRPAAVESVNAAGAAGPQTRAAMLRRLGIGAGTVVLGGVAALGARAWEQGVFTPGSGVAYEPWTSWRSHDGPLALVAAAILAANAHDVQPWIFHVAPDRVDVFADPARTLGPADPYGREIDVSLGCAIENMALAAPPNGLRARVALLPRPGVRDHVARIELAAGAPPVSALYARIAQRHTNRGPFDAARPLARDTLRALEVVRDDEAATVRVFWFTAAPQRAAIGALIVSATEAFVADGAQSRESFAWYRADERDVERHGDGLTLDAQGMPAALAALAKLLPASSREAGDAYWLAATRDTHVATAQAYGMIAVRDPRDRAQRLSGGRVLQRVHLAATGAGIALHHMNQLTERADREASLGAPPRFSVALAGLLPAPWRTLATFRLGYAVRSAPPSPRRPLAAVTVGRA